MTFPLRAADGGYRAFLTRVIPVKNSRGTVIRWFGTNTDVETERQIIRERDAALAATNRAIEVRDEFLSVGSHELKTPLAALLLHIDSLCHPRAVESPPVRLSDRLKKASQAGHRLARLIDELLDVSRVAAAGLRLEAQAMDLSALVREVCARYESKAPGGIDLSADQPTHGQWDPLRVEQVASNLIDNAVKYGDGKPISVAVRREGGKAILKVADQGIGISAAERPFIFERFARGSRAKNYGGFGLGLWIVRQVVNATGGTVEMDSAEGTGTTVTVTLPIEPRRA
jgi:signal transduction histidine kinase